MSGTLKIVSGQNKSSILFYVFFNHHAFLVHGVLYKSKWISWYHLKFYYLWSLNSIFPVIHFRIFFGVYLPGYYCIKILIWPIYDLGSDATLVINELYNLWYMFLFQLQFLHLCNLAVGSNITGIFNTTIYLNIYAHGFIWKYFNISNCSK